MSERVRIKRAKSEKTDTGEKKEVSKAMQSSKDRSIKSVGVKDSLLFFFPSFLPSFLPSSFSAFLFLSRKERKKRSNPHPKAGLTYRRYSSTGTWTCRNAVPEHTPRQTSLEVTAASMPARCRTSEIDPPHHQTQYRTITNRPQQQRRFQSLPDSVGLISRIG